MDTIFAQATAPGRAGVSVVRISGPAAHEAAARVAGPLPAPRRTALRRVVDEDGSLLDEALLIVFEGPCSFTGEDVVELHLHGSIAVVKAVLDLLGRQPGLRMADPGEFTRRALENDRLDLAQVEGLADLIDAETEGQRVQAQRVLSGHLGDLVEGWRRDLIRAAALIEATIDFADEDVPVDVTPEVSGLLDSVGRDLAKEITGSRVAERIRSGFEVAIVGPPNAGKSTLLNALAGREAAITSEVAGTTRDVVEVRMDLGGLAVTLLDTAGLRDTEDAIETIGVARAMSRAAEADLRVFLLEPGEQVKLDPLAEDIVVVPKADLHGGNGVSGRTGQGLEELIARISKVLSERTSTAGIATHARHRDAMRVAADHLIRARASLDVGPDSYDIAADDLQFAIRALEALVGRIDVENLLDEIFASFCLGK